MKANFLRYNRCFFIGCSFLVFTIIALCYFVDPYAIYGRVYKKNGQDVNGHGFASQLRMSKVVAIKKNPPDILLLGSSRVAFGFSPQSVQRHFPNQAIYNLGLLGITEYELMRYFQHASAFKSLKHVIIGLDLLQFNANQPARPDFVEQRLQVDANNKPNKIYTGDYLPTLFSVDAAITTFKEITGTAKKQDLYFTNGFRVDYSDGGNLSNFIINEKGYVNGVYSNFAFQNANGSMDTLACFQKILELAQQQKIQLHLFISPAHARQWETIESMGLWQTWENWKRHLVTINESVAAQHHAQPFQLFDFSGYSQYSTEEVPRTAGSFTKRYRDSAHFLPVVGEQVLQRMFKPASALDNSFGALLTPATLEENLKNIRAGHLHYVATHPLDKADIDKLVQERKQRLAKF